MIGQFAFIASLTHLCKDFYGISLSDTCWTSGYMSVRDSSEMYCVVFVCDSE